jgi:hypothetical protein
LFPSFIYFAEQIGFADRDILLFNIPVFSLVIFLHKFGDGDNIATTAPSTGAAATVPPPSVVNSCPHCQGTGQLPKPKPISGGGGRKGAALVLISSMVATLGCFVSR